MNTPKYASTNPRMTFPARHTHLLLAAMLLVLGLAPAALAQPFALPWFKVHPGGGESSGITETGRTFIISGIAGQSDAGPDVPMSGSDAGSSFSVSGGFWVGVESNPPCPADYNVDGDLNADDLADYINCFFDAAACERGDFDRDGDVDDQDLNGFVGAYFVGCP